MPHTAFHHRRPGTGLSAGIGDAVDRNGLDWIAPQPPRARDPLGLAWIHTGHHFRVTHDSIPKRAAPRSRCTGEVNAGRRTRGRGGRRDRWRARERWAAVGRWGSACALAGLSVALVTGGVLHVVASQRQPPPVAVPPILAPAAPNPAAELVTGTGTCAGMVGAVVTDGPGDRDSAAGVIAAFQHAYYVRRSADAVLSVVATQAGLNARELDVGIASIPPGTRHCVAVTPASAQSADVHLAEQRPDGTRRDYRQFVTVTGAAGSTLITGIHARR